MTSSWYSCQTVTQKSFQWKIRKMSKNLKIILTFILHDSKIKGKNFSSYLLTFGKRFITKCVKILLKNLAAFFDYKTWTKWVTKHGSFFVTKCVDVITKYGQYYKMHQFYYRTRQVLQNASIITKHIITNVSYYNLTS